MNPLTVWNLCCPFQRGIWLRGNFTRRAGDNWFSSQRPHRGVKPRHNSMIEWRLFLSFGPNPLPKDMKNDQGTEACVSALLMSSPKRIKVSAAFPLVSEPVNAFPMFIHLVFSVCHWNYYRHLFGICLCVFVFSWDWVRLLLYYVRLGSENWKKKTNKQSRSCHKLICLNAYVIRLKVVLLLTPLVHKGEAVISWSLMGRVLWTLLRHHLRETGTPNVENIAK